MVSTPSTPITTPVVTPASGAGFLQDNNGNNSAMRLMSLIALIAAICFGSYTLVNSKDVGSVGTNITFAFLAASFGGKAAQKFAE
ncbi:MAG: hypothetical protein VKL42_05065 [Snowella sp.]|nr:hypothetical protein [Snowella sp.]